MQTKWSKYQEQYVAEYGLASPGKNWGYCSKECDDDEENLIPRTEFSGIGVLTMLSSEKCKDLVKV